MYTKFSEIWTCGFRDMQVDRQTDIQNTLITILHTATAGPRVWTPCQDICDRT